MGIDNKKGDYTGLGWWFNQIGYKYFTTDQMVNKSSMSEAKLNAIALQNYKLLIQYQTWMLGDHVPPAYAPPAYGASGRDPCLSNSICRRECSWSEGDPMIRHA